MVGPSRRLAIVVLATAVLAAVGCRGAQSGLDDIQDVGALQQQFDADAGKPRVVLLLSPT